MSCERYSHLHTILGLSNMTLSVIQWKFCLDQCQTNQFCADLCSRSEPGWRTANRRRCLCRAGSRARTAERMALSDVQEKEHCGGVRPGRHGQNTVERTVRQALS